MLHFYGSPNSSSGRTHWLIEELGIPHEYHRVNLRDPASKSADFLSASPGGRVPAIADGNYRLFESGAINSYLAEKHRPDLVGTSPEERGLIQQWSLFALTNLQPEVLAVMYHSALLPEVERIAKVAARARDDAAPLVLELERALAGRDFLVGDRFTLADVNVASVVNIAVFLKMVGSDAPSVAAYMSGMRARPAYQKAAKSA
jgi:glutathione S-transferase